eukprot:SAG11_NODE_3879_length_2171_cov_5.673745_1_plen_140_part_00
MCGSGAPRQLHKGRAVVKLTGGDVASRLAAGTDQLGAHRGAVGLRRPGARLSVAPSAPQWGEKRKKETRAGPQGLWSQPRVSWRGEGGVPERGRPTHRADQRRAVRVVRAPETAALGRDEPQRRPAAAAAIVKYPLLVA